MKVELEAEVREQVGKGVARQLRRKGKIPAVLYGQGDCVLLSLDPTPVIKAFKSTVGRTALISLNIDGAASKKGRIALLRDWQVDPVSGALLHMDLFEVSMSKPIRLKVPVSVVGAVPAGVKEGGLLQHNVRELHIECLPGDLPDAVEVDATNLAIGQSMHVKELQVGKGIRFLDEPDHMVISVAAPMTEAKLEALLTSGAGPEETKEPEVIGKATEAAPEEADKAAAAAPEPKAEAKEGKEAKKEEKKK